MKWTPKQSPQLELPYQSNVPVQTLHARPFSEVRESGLAAYTQVIPDNTDGVMIEVSGPTLIRADTPVTPGSADTHIHLFYAEQQGSTSPTSSNLTAFSTRYAHLWKAGKWRLYNLTGLSLDFACTVFPEYPVESYQALLASMNYSRVQGGTDITLPAGVNPVQLVTQTEMAMVTKVILSATSAFVAGTGVRVGLGVTASPTNGMILWSGQNPVTVSTSLCTVSANTAGGGIKLISVTKYYG